MERWKRGFLFVFLKIISVLSVDGGKMNGFCCKSTKDRKQKHPWLCYFILINFFFSEPSVSLIFTRVHWGGLLRFYIIVICETKCILCPNILEQKKDVWWVEKSMRRFFAVISVLRFKKKWFSKCPSYVQRFCSTIAWTDFDRILCSSRHSIQSYLTSQGLSIYL